MAGKNVFPDGSAGYAKNNSTEFQLFSSTGQLYHNGSAITANTSDLNNAGSKLAESVATGSSAATLVNYGVSSITGTSTAALTLTLAAPLVGIRKVLACQEANSTQTVTIFTGSSATTILGTSAANNIVFSTKGIVELIGVTTAQWALLSEGGGYAISASTVDGTITWARPTFTTSTT